MSGVADAFRLPAALRLGAVTLQVADLARSIAYYTEVLGLRELRRGEPGVELGAAGRSEPLVVLRERVNAARVPRGGLLGLYHYALLLPDRSALGRFLAHLRHRGVSAGAADHLVSEALYLTDPDGLGIEVYADRPRAQWRTLQGELQMATLALDADAVIASAHGAVWDGMPAGACIGHVHLHVGNVQDGARFYDDALGFEPMVWSYPGALFLAAGGYHHHLAINGWAGNARAAAESDARLLEWRVVLRSPDDVERALGNVRRRGISTAADGTVADPWGTVVRIVAG